MEKNFGKIQKSDLQKPPKFKQFLTIFTLYFRILTIFFVTNHYNWFWSTKFAYRNQISQKTACRSSMGLYRQISAGQIA